MSGTVIGILVQLGVWVLCLVCIIITCCSFLSTFLTYVYSFKYIYIHPAVYTWFWSPGFQSMFGCYVKGLVSLLLPDTHDVFLVLLLPIVPTTEEFLFNISIFTPKSSLEILFPLLLWHPSFLTLPLLLCSFLLILLLCPPWSPLLSRCSSAGSALSLLTSWLASTLRPPPNGESCPLLVFSLLWVPC